MANRWQCHPRGIGIILGQQLHTEFLQEGTNMKKIEGLYRSYCHERELEMQEYHTGGNRMKDLQEFLKSKLNAEDYFTAEELLNDLIAETEEKGFAAGAKYTAGLGKELFAE